MTKSASEMIIYQSEDGRIRLETRLQNETLWMTQSQMADLFGCSADNISLHLKNIYEENELIEASTTEEFSVVRLEGEREVSRSIKHYNLDAVISVGYRVKSVIATRFRIWATQQLKEYIIKGFVMDDERLKNPPVGQSVVPDYFAEMLERVRDIRASERRVYLRVREIFALAADYEPTLAETTKFFSVIQNKLHFAATGMTAAELIASRADHAKPNMGLNTWQNDEVRKTDVLIAKNYLAEKEVTELNRIVTMWLDFAEDQATRRKQVFMQDWADKLDEFLRFNDRAVLNNAGRVSKKQADAKAALEYEQFAQKRRVTKEAEAEKDYISQLTDVAKLNDKKKHV
jgi:hypothetical protein